MFDYNVYKQEEGVLHYSASSRALGTGGRDLAFIVDGHGLEAGDVIEMKNTFYLILSVEEEPASPQEPPAVIYEFLPPCTDHNHMFKDGPWSPQMVARLRREADGR